MKKIFNVNCLRCLYAVAITLILTSNAHAFGIKIKSPKIKVGGDLGKVINKVGNVISTAAPANFVMGPLGAIVTLQQQAQTVKERRHAQDTVNRMQQEANVFKVASEKFPNEASGVENGYRAISQYLGSVNATDDAFNLLTERYLEAGRCLYNSAAQDQANACLDTFDDQSEEIRRQNR